MSGEGAVEKKKENEKKEKFLRMRIRKRRSFFPSEPLPNKSGRNFDREGATERR